MRQIQYYFFRILWVLYTSIIDLKGLLYLAVLVSCEAEISFQLSAVCGID